MQVGPALRAEMIVRFGRWRVLDVFEGWRLVSHRLISLSKLHQLTCPTQRYCFRIKHSIIPRPV